MSGSGLFLTSVLITVVPIFIYLWVLWTVDKYEKEPGSLVAAALLGGAIVAPALTTVLESVFGVPSSVYPAAFQVFALAPSSPAGAVIEEITKALIVLAVYLRFRNEFDGTLDGVIYGAAVGAGFALTESLTYVRVIPSLPADAGFGPGFFFGILMSGLTHCVFTGIFGAALGYTRETNPQGSGRVGIPLGGLLAAIFYHLAYVGATATGQAGVGGGVASLLGGLRQVANWSGLALLALVIVWAMGRERDLLQWALADETAGGVVAVAELEALHARGALPAGPLRAALAELAFTKWRAVRGHATDEDIARARQAVQGLRAAAKGADR
jgi:RsiW-degrading membrane proteinase PrsW (M82 family)